MKPRASSQLSRRPSGGDGLPWLEGEGSALALEAKSNQEGSCLY